MKRPRFSGGGGMVAASLVGTFFSVCRLAVEGRRLRKLQLLDLMLLDRFKMLLARLSVVVIKRLNLHMKVT